MLSNRITNILLTALPLLLLASCGGNSNQSAQAPSTQDAKTEFCTKLARFDTSVATLKSMSPSSTVGDLKNAQAQVKTTFNDVKSVASNVQDAKSADLERAYQELDSAIQAVPTTATLKQASQSIAPKISAVQAAEDQMKSSVKCP